MKIMMKPGDFTVSEGHGYPLVHHIIRRKIVRTLSCSPSASPSPWLALLESRSFGCFPPFWQNDFLDVVCDLFFCESLFSYHSINFFLYSYSSFPWPFPPLPTHHHHRQPIIRENESKRQLSFFRPPLWHPLPNAYLLFFFEYNVPRCVGWGPIFVLKPGYREWGWGGSVSVN
jgi:hypothetical protein